MTNIPVFETNRLILRGVMESDAPAYERHFVDYEVIKNLTNTVPWPYPKGGVLDYINMQILPKQGDDKWVWGIFLKSSPAELIGAVDLWRAGKPEHRGFWLARRFWGQGIMTEAVEPVMNYAFDSLGFEKLVFSNAAGNDRSRRVKEKTGARFLYTEPKEFVSPEFTEHEIWELTKEEWKNFQNKISLKPTREGNDACNP